MLKEMAGHRASEREEESRNGTYTLAHAESIGLGSRAYDLVEV